MSKMYGPHTATVEKIIASIADLTEEVALDVFDCMTDMDADVRRADQVASNAVRMAALRAGRYRAYRAAYEAVGDAVAARCGSKETPQPWSALAAALQAVVEAVVVRDCVTDEVFSRPFGYFSYSMVERWEADE